jgi:hypothetical protein
MANQFYTAAQAAGVALRMVESDQYLSALIARNVIDPLKGGGAGRTVELKLPNGLIARDRSVDDKTTALIFDELQEQRITVTAGSAAYSGVTLSDGDLSLNLESFSDQVLSPQVDAVVEKIEGAVATQIRSIPLNTTVKWDPTRPDKTFTAIRKVLRLRGVPQAGIVSVVGVNVYAALLDANLLVDASSSGSTAALREGQIGRLRGFTIVESTRVADDEIIAFHRDAFTLTVKAPVAPAGAPFSAAVSGNGYALRYLRGFDITVANERSLVDTMYAITAMPMYKIAQDGTTNRTKATVVPAGQDATFRMSIADTEPTA